MKIHNKDVAVRQMLKIPDLEQKSTNCENQTNCAWGSNAAFTL